MKLVGILLIINQNFVLLFIFILVGVCTSQVPAVVSYQGRLTDDAGNPLIGVHTLTFKLYNAAEGGIVLWTETHTETLTVEGLYSSTIGSITTFTSGGIDFFIPYWLSIAVDGGAEIGRYRVTTTPYSFHAAYADSAPPEGCVLTINDVSPDGSGNVELVEGENITITEVADSN